MSGQADPGPPVRQSRSWEFTLRCRVEVRQQLKWDCAHQNIRVLQAVAGKKPAHNDPATRSGRRWCRCRSKTQYASMYIFHSNRSCSRTHGSPRITGFRNEARGGRKSASKLVCVTGGQHHSDAPPLRQCIINDPSPSRTHEACRIRALLVRKIYSTYSVTSMLCRCRSPQVTFPPMTFTTNTSFFLYRWFSTPTAGTAHGRRKPACWICDHAYILR